MIKWILAAIILFVAATQQCKAGEMDSQLFQAFRDYRLALSNDESNVLTYFDRPFLEEELSSIIKTDNEGLQHNVNATKFMLYIGKLVVTLYSWRVHCQNEDKCRLILDYGETANGRFNRLVIVYHVSKREKPLIAGVELHINGFTPGPKATPAMVFPSTTRDTTRDTHKSQSQVP